MRGATRSAATLAVLGSILAIWLLYGYSQVTQPFPGRVAAPICSDVPVAAGERVRPGDVTISVLNAGTREGLAGRTMQLFVDAGFGRGDSDNAPEGTEVTLAQVWTLDPTNPAVKLITSRIKGAEVVEQAGPGAGITVVVGDEFQELAQGRKGVKAKTDTTLCSPTDDVPAVTEVPVT